MKNTRERMAQGLTLQPSISIEMMKTIIILLTTTFFLHTIYKACSSSSSGDADRFGGYLACSSEMYRSVC